MPYIGTSPSNGVRRKHTYTATASQTSFSGAGAEGATLSYNDSNFVDVYQNGVKLSEADYTSTSGTAIVLATGATVSDIVEVVVYDVFSVADTVSKADGGTFDNAVTITTDNNNAQLTLTSTDADANSAPLFLLDRNSASPADSDRIAEIVMRGRNDAGQSVDYIMFDSFITDASDGTEDSELDIRTMVGGSEATRILLDPAETVFNEASIDLDFRVESNGNANMLFVDGGNDSVIIGHNDGTNGTFLSQAAFQVVGTNAVSAHIGLSRSSDNSAPCTLSFTKSRGAVGTDTAVQDDDEIGQILFAAGDGTDLSSQAANIKVAIDGTPGANDVPSRMTFATTADGANSPTERARLNSSGVFMVGQTAFNYANVGCSFTSSGQVGGTANGDVAAVFNRTSSNGNIIELRYNNSAVGRIGSGTGRFSINGTNGSTGSGIQFDINALLPQTHSGSLTDDDIDLGSGTYRFDDVFATNGSIQTSDRNEKQDIEELTDAEKRVAVVAKGLMRKYRWKSKVAEKGDKARTHFGIIAQDLEDAFKAESLDASNYGMFCSDTWWEKEITVDAVEAKDAVYEEVTDSDGMKTNNLVSHAVKAQDAYTYTDTKQEATEGYTEKTRLGVRYSELLAFIISAI